MPSRVERTRVTAERLLRVVSLALIAWMGWTLIRPSPRPETMVVLRDSGIRERLREWTLGPAPNRVHAMFDTVPTARTRDWLTALRRNGTALGWSAGTIPELAVEVEPIAEPHGGARVLIATPGDQDIRLGDDLGPLDSARSGNGGVSFALPRLDGTARVSLGRHTARAALADSLRLGNVVVIGRASWETRFIADALEERGWRIDVRQVIAPGLEARRGSDVPIDTSRVAAVIAADSSAARQAARIASFVQSGGGLVLLGEAARAPAFDALAAGRVGNVIRPSELSFAADVPRRALVVHPIAGLRADAIALERAPSGVAAAGRRHGNGRIVQLGFEDTWRWRLSGGEDAPVAHRVWWSRVVASVAYRSERPIARQLTGDAAPLSALIDALGPSTPPPAVSKTSQATSVLRGWMLALLFAMLFAEWASRRLRGAR